MKSTLQICSVLSVLQCNAYLCCQGTSGYVPPEFKDLEKDGQHSNLTGALLKNKKRDAGKCPWRLERIFKGIIKSPTQTSSMRSMQNQ